LTTGDNNIDIGNAGNSADSGTIRIGNATSHTAAFIAGINGVNASAGVPVFILSTGQLGTGPAAANHASASPGATAPLRFKQEMNAMKATVAELKSLVAKQQATIAQQQKDFQAAAAQQQKEIKALTASVKEQAKKIQKVSDRVELKQPAPQVVGNHR